MKRAAAFGDRFREARVAAQLSQDELADRLSITKSAVSQWELGNKSPRFELWPAIKRELRTSLDLLILGEPQGRASALSVAEPRAVYEVTRTPSDLRNRQFGQLFSQLPDHQQKAVMDLLRSMARMQSNQPDARKVIEVEPTA